MRPTSTRQSWAGSQRKAASRMAMRRSIRRAVQQGARVGLEPPYLAPLADVVIDQMQAGYPELEEHRDEIHRVLTAEEERFGKTLERGMRLFEEVAEKDEAISGEEAFGLHDTYGCQ